MIYLDYQATTPLAPQALDAMLPWLENGFANPHSTHVPGRAAAAAIEVAREQIAALMPPGGRVIFTSGATEAINLAVAGAIADAPHNANVVTIDTEHAAVRDSISERAKGHFTQARMPVGRDGMVNLDAMTRAIDDNTVLVAAMAVNNEIGVMQLVDRIAARAREVGALYLCDAVQGYGRVDLPQDADMIAISAHKIYGPKGIGALWLRDGVTLPPLLHGGGQEQGVRSGTLSPALCAGFGAAAQLMAERQEIDEVHIEALWTAARTALSGWTLNGSANRRYLGNLNIRLPGLDAARLLSECRDLAISAGSACSSGSGRPSHVLKAIGLSDAEARSSLRIGFGRYTTLAEIEAAAEMLNAAAQRQGIDL